MQPELFNEVQQWYVVFSKRRVPRCRLIHWLVCPALSHVYLMRERPDGGTMIIDPMKWGMAVKYVELGFDDALLLTAQECTALLGFTADYRNASLLNRMPFVFTCVTAVKAILGLRSWSLTPRQLYKRLLKSGYTTPVKLHDPHDSASHHCRHCGADTRRA